MSTKKAFTKEALERLTFKPEEQIVWDAKYGRTGSLGVRVSPASVAKPKKSLFVQYRTPDGKQAKKTIGSVGKLVVNDGRSVDEIRRMADEIACSAKTANEMKQVTKQETRHAREVRAASAMSIKGLGERFIEAREAGHWRRGSYADGGAQMRLALDKAQTFWNDRSVADLRPEDGAAFLNDISTKRSVRGTKTARPGLEARTRAIKLPSRPRDF